MHEYPTRLISRPKNHRPSNRQDPKCKNRWLPFALLDPLTIISSCSLSWISWLFCCATLDSELRVEGYICNWSLGLACWDIDVILQIAYSAHSSDGHSIRSYSCKVKASESRWYRIEKISDCNKRKIWSKSTSVSLITGWIFSLNVLTRYLRSFYH